MNFNVYIITNRKDGVLYIGKTKRLKQRIFKHKNKVHPNPFSARYGLDKLVYFEKFKSEEEARIREKRMKKWNRKWKIELIEKMNPYWRDLSKDL